MTARTRRPSFTAHPGRRRQALLPLGAALVLGLGPVLSACGGDDRSAQVEGAVATFPDQTPGPARATLDTSDGPTTLLLDRCVAVEPDTIELSGTKPNGGTLQVRIGAVARTVLYSEPAALQSGTVEGVSVDGQSRRFTVTGTLRPTGGGDRDAVGPFTLSGRCPS